MQERLIRLQKERDSLLAAWARASGKEKRELLARILEIDDQIEGISREQKRAVARASR